MNALLQDQTALVTGASRGIGKAIAAALAACGARVGVNYRTNDQAALATRDEIIASGGLARCFQADVAKGDEATALVNDFLAWTDGRIDILVNNAGITRDAVFLRMSEADWDVVQDTNLKGAFLVTKAAVKSMVKRRFGRIINVTSVVGLMGNAGQSNYAAAKAGMVGLTKSLAKELGSRNILVNAVAPGFIESELTAKLDSDRKGKYLEQLPLGRFGDPTEVADLVVFLATKGTYITGQVFNVDGGMLT